jgi:integrase
MAKRLPSPFKCRDKWRAQVTMPDGKRPAKDFDQHEEAKAWIVRMLAEAASASGHEAKLGGPTVATLADALTYYAGQWTVNKGGARAELNRINHYREAAGMPQMCIRVDGNNKKSLVVADSQHGASAFTAYSALRRGLRQETYETIAKLARRRCSAISPADIRELMSTMAREGLSESTIQKEIALLRHVFNTAIQEWSWVAFKNPCLGLKLGKSESRFVVLPSAKVQALMEAAHGCDNPFVAAAIGLALDTTMRKNSLLSLDWSRIDLENRTLQVDSKTGGVVLALSTTTLAILNNLPKSSAGRVLPLSDNGLDMAWEGVRKKAGVPNLQFRDLRHVAATRLAKRGMSAHQLQRVLGHKSITMAQVYVNMVQADMVEVLDKLSPLDPVLVLKPLTASAGEEISRRRSDRITGAIKKKAQVSTKMDGLAKSSTATPAAPDPAVPEVRAHAEQPPLPAHAAVVDQYPSTAPGTPNEVSTPSNADTPDMGVATATVLLVDFRARKVVNG